LEIAVTSLSKQKKKKQVVLNLARVRALDRLEQPRYDRMDLVLEVIVNVDAQLQVLFQVVRMVRALPASERSLVSC
jgi:hypothetical protein